MGKNKMGAGGYKPSAPSKGTKGPNDKGGGTGNRPANLPKKNSKGAC